MTDSEPRPHPAVPLHTVPGVRDAVVARRADTVAVSPIIAGAALKGPADRLLRVWDVESASIIGERIYERAAPIRRRT